MLPPLEFWVMYGPDRSKERQTDCLTYWLISIPWYLQTCRNGLISFEEPWYRRWPYNFGQYYWFDGQALLAPYWSLIDSTDAFRNGISKMYYHVYKKSDGNPSTASILERARSDVNKHCQKNPLPTEFREASWVMVVTWVNIRHWYARWRWDLRDMVCCT